MYNTGICLPKRGKSHRYMGILFGLEESEMKRHHLVLLAASLVLLNGCGGIESAKTSTITVSKDGIVTTVLLEDFME